MLRGSFVRIGRDGCYSPAVAFRITGLTRDCASFNHCYCDRIHATRPCLSWRPRWLAPTKMNWNSTQFDQATPIRIRAARQVGRVLKYVPFGQAKQSDYRFCS
jgi:hypothetical protein